MNKKKTILGILLVLVVLASALYLKKESTYSMVQDQRKSENSQGKTQDGSDDRSPQDIAADKKIAKQRAKNRKDWLEKGMTGSVTRGGDIVLGPRGDERARNYLLSWINLCRIILNQNRTPIPRGKRDTRTIMTQSWSLGQRWITELMK